MVLGGNWGGCISTVLIGVGVLYKMLMVRRVYSRWACDGGSILDTGAAMMVITILFKVAGYGFSTLCFGES